ncbi:ABC transporter ATP-binding protein [Oryzibacter oryziterrae]|uniref:ABC transporter ATP-binding protein n=1 Tax=Oryzibacter oryziterrae TaxID=2766474 RepID=UPI001F20230A|nr:ABC transporter ATP-binding protein [Oryzibacter oryziterrae]
MLTVIRSAFGALFSFFESRIDPFKPTQGQHPLTPPTTNWKMLRFFLGETGWPLLLMVGLTAVTTLIEIAVPVSIGKLIDTATQHDADAVREVHVLDYAVFVLLLLVVRPAFGLLASLVRNQTLSRNVGTLVRWRTHEYVAKADIAFFQGDFVGRIATKVTQTGQAIRSLIRLFTDQLLYVTVYLAGTVLYLLFQHPLFALPLIGWVVIYGAVMWHYIPRSRAIARQVAETGSIFSGRLVDGYSNYLIVRLFTGLGREDAFVRDALEDGVAASGAQQRMLTGMTTFLTLLNGALLASGGVVGLLLWQHRLATPGEVAGVIALMLQVQQMSRVTTMNLSDLFESIGTLEDSVRSLSKPQTVIDVPAAQPLRMAGGEIALDKVLFDYGRGRPAGARAIDGISLTIRPGERIGLVGPSGAGKSTLVNLLLRLYNLEGGRISIDGQDIASVTQDSLRSAVGVVTQDTSLLHRSLRDNIKYGRPDASDADMIAAAQQAHADGFIDDLQDQRGRRGYEAFVGERGVKLSGGQRQRIAIARVLLKNAPILVLDEATSALDSDIEAAIQESLDDLMAGKTVIAVAHRLSTIARMDRLIVMDQGRIVEEGTHAQLIGAGGLYARLWARQSGGFMGVEPVGEADASAISVAT